MKNSKFLLVVALLCMSIQNVAADDNVSSDDASEDYVQPDYMQMIEDDGGADMVLQFFFLFNILFYQLYCRFISSITFKNDTETDDYKEYRDLCVSGAYYEL